MSRAIGRGRGVDNTPAWMKQMQRDKQDAVGSVPNKSNGNSNHENTVKSNGKSSSRGRSRSRSPPPVKNSGGQYNHNYGRNNRGGGGGGGGYRNGGGRNNGGGMNHRGNRSMNHRPPPTRFVNEPNTMPARIVSRKNATREEWEWNEDRRRRRISRRRDPNANKFDVQPSEEYTAMELQAKAAYAMKAAGSINPSFLHPNQLEAQQSGQVNQQTRHARRLYVGNVPEMIREDEVKAFFLECVETATGRNYRGPGEVDPILSVYINRERRFAFVEFRTVEMCTSCLNLDGINLAGQGTVKIKRPNDFNPALLTPDPAGMAGFDASKLGIVSSNVPDGPNKIFIGGLPYHLTDAQVLELLTAFGAVKAFHLVRDLGSPTSKGYGFVEYSDTNVTDIAVMGLEGMDLGGGKTLTARRAAAKEGGSVPEDTYHAPQAPHIPGPPISHDITGAGLGMNAVGVVDVEALLNAAMGGAAPMPAANVPSQPPASVAQQVPDALAVSAAVDAALGQQTTSYQPQNISQNQQSYNNQTVTSILVLYNMVLDDDLATNEAFTDLYDEVKGECEKYGRLISMKIPRASDGHAPSAMKKIFLEYASPSDASNAANELGGRAFGPNVVQCSYFDENLYREGTLN